MYEYYWDGENWLKTALVFGIRIYHLNNMRHRKDGPAFINYINKNFISLEEYRYYDFLHRENGPALSWYYEDGSISMKEYYLNGKRHRKDGPAAVIYHIDGLIKDEEYWFNDIKFDPDDLSFELPIDTEEKQFLFNLKYGENND